MKTPVTLTLERLAQLLSVKTGETPEQCTAFIKEYFDTISQGITDDNTVTVRNLGIFKVLSDNISFVADDAFSQIVNAPFAALPTFPLMDDEDIDIPTDNTDDLLDSIANVDEEPELKEEQMPIAGDDKTEKINIEQPKESIVIQEATVIIPSEPDESTAISSTQLAEANNSQPTECEAETSIIIENPGTRPIEEENRIPNTAVEENQTLSFAEKRIHARKRPSRCSFYVWTSVLFVVGLVLGTCLGYLWYHKINAFFAAPIGSVDNEKPAIVVVEQVKTPSAPPIDTVAAPVQSPDTVATTTAKDTIVEPTKTVDKPKPEPRKPRYDTVDKRTYLATLARRYYGCGDYWVYIYQANKDKKKLKHPDRIAPGTQLLIPYKDELPLTGNDSADLLAARRLGSAIYARF